MFINLFRKFYHRIKPLNVFRLSQEIDLLYTLLYEWAHDNEYSPDAVFSLTQKAFAYQWENLEEGKALLSHDWFKENVSTILAEQELQIKPEWFKGKKILDAGCGNGRWSYGFSRLGADVTCVDVNPAAIEKTRVALQGFNNEQRFIVSKLEDLSQHLDTDEKFDLVFSWGVLHHTQSFNRSLKQVVQYVKEEGLLYLYLYGRGSIPYKNDIKLFKLRLQYNLLRSKAERHQFLLEKAKGSESLIHNLHDQYAPLINRRFTFNEIKHMLEQLGFQDIVRTFDHSELFIRAMKHKDHQFYADYVLAPPSKPYWFDIVLDK